jgi:hypothetical protein
MKATNRQLAFTKAYKQVDSQEAYEDLLSKFAADVTFDDRYDQYEVFIPSRSMTQQAVIFNIEPCGYEVIETTKGGYR